MKNTTDTTTTEEFYPLYELLDARGIGINALARLAGISRDTSRRIFHGFPVLGSIAYQVADALQVHPLDMWEYASDSLTCNYRTARKGRFILPPVYGRGAEWRWEEAFGDHPDAPKRRAEAAKRKAEAAAIRE
jgi:lambda repressor-like predicted transcriptional regulator